MSGYPVAQQQRVPLKSVFEDAFVHGRQPELDLDWEPFQAHVEAFLNAIDTYTADAKTEIAARAADHVTLVRELNAEKEEVERVIALEKNSEVVMLEAVQHERHVIQDLSASLSHLQANLAKVKEQSATLEAELNSLRKEVVSERAEKERQGKKLKEMQERDEKDTLDLEDAIGFTIEGAGENVLLMRMTLLDPSDPAREFTFVLDISKQDYAVPRCSPPLPTLQDMVKQLNTDRDIYAFIKKIRKAFKALIPSPDPPSSRFASARTPGRKEALSSTTANGAKEADVGGAMAALQLGGP